MPLAAGAGEGPWPPSAAPSSSRTGFTAAVTAVRTGATTAATDRAARGTVAPAGRRVVRR